MTATTASAGAEAEAGTEVRAEAGAEAAARAEGRTVVATTVLAELLTQLLAELATAMPVVSMASPCGGETETRAEAGTKAGTAHLRASELGKWGVHGSSRFWSGNAECVSDTLTIYRKLSRCNVQKDL